MSEKNTEAAYFLKNRDAWIRMVVNDPDLEHTVVRVGLHIAMRMRAGQQYCWPTIDTIAKDTGVSRRAVSNALDKLCEGDHKMVLRTSRPNRGNMYALNFPWV